MLLLFLVLKYLFIIIFWGYASSWWYSDCGMDWPSYSNTVLCSLIGGCSSSVLNDPAGGGSGRGKYSKGM